jgi:FMN phosphatase YigB (HAD superfamily)
MVSHTVELFQKKFIDGGRGCDSREIVLYGLGRQTEEVLHAFPSFPIAGLLDGYREEGEIYGKEIIPLASLVGRNVKIVILARKASQKIIYRRIQNFCKEQGIPVFALDGNPLDRVRIGETDETYFRLSLDDLREKVKSYDMISFDIFDTLLTRKVPQPEIVFQMVGARNGMSPEFARMRMMAELELSKSGVPTIFNIYQWIGERMKLSPERLDVLLEDEITFEKFVLEPRQIMVSLLQEMIFSGKKVYLVSDMYIPAEILEGILNMKGICGYNGLFVSCDYGTGKAGSLYEIYINHSSGERRIHIGDSEELDGRAAQSHGIDTFLIRSPQEMAELISMGKALTQTGAATVVQGMIYARLYNNPFVLYNCGGKLQPETPFDLGYGILGPILAGYVHWLCGQIRKEPLDVMLFIARDGYLVKKVYDMWKRVKGHESLPESVYLMTSRTFSMFAALQTQADILYASGLSFDGSAEEMLRKRFYLQEEDIMPRRPKEGDKAYILRHAGLILPNAALARSAYQEYLSGFHFRDKKIGIFDFVSTGTCQMCLEKILETAMKGYYFQRIADSDEMKKALLIEDFMHANKPEYEFENYFLLEVWMKELCPSVRWVEANGSVQYCEQYCTLHQEEHIGEMHRGALAFCKDYLKVIEYGAEDFDIEKFAIAILPFIDEEFIKMDLRQLKGYDTFCSRKIVFS